LFAKVNGKDVIGGPMLHNINGFVIKSIGNFTWMVSDCEELVGGTHRRWWDWPCQEY